MHSLFECIRKILRTTEHREPETHGDAQTVGQLQRAGNSIQGAQGQGKLELLSEMSLLVPCTAGGSLCCLLWHSGVVVFLCIK